MRKVTATQASKVAELIKKAFPAHSQFKDGNYDKMVPVTNPDYLPRVMQDWDGHDFAIAWESGSPYDWTYNFPFGGVDEEFGGTVKDVSAGLPAGVRVEAVNSCVIALYRD